MSDDKDNFIRFSVTVPEKLLSEFENSSRKKNRSEAIRDLMRHKVAEERWKLNNKKIFATVTLVYDHHLPELTRKLTSVQHDYGNLILCSTHVHINHLTCLECVITKGFAHDIQKFIEALEKIRGIKTLNINTASEM